MLFCFKKKKSKKEKRLSWKAVCILCFVLGNKHLPLLCRFNAAFNDFCTRKYILSNMMPVNWVFMSCDRLLLMAGIYQLHQTLFDRLLPWERWSWAPRKAQRPAGGVGDLSQIIKSAGLSASRTFPSLSGWPIAIFMPISMVTSFGIKYRNCELAACPQESCHGPGARALARGGPGTCIPMGLGRLRQLLPVKGEISPSPLAWLGNVSSALLSCLETSLRNSYADYSSPPACRFAWFIFRFKWLCQ